MVGREAGESLLWSFGRVEPQKGGLERDLFERVKHFRGDLSRGDQDERPIEHTRVRNGEPGEMDDLIPEQQ